jgi:hypothetical protein
MSSSSSSNSYFLNSDDFISYSNSSDEDVLEDMDQNDLVIFQIMMMTTFNFDDLFISREMEEQQRQFVDPIVRIQDVLWYYAKHTNITQNFDELYIGNH